MSRAHQALMGVNANPRANAKMVAHVIQSMANAIVLVDGRYKSLVATATDEMTLQNFYYKLYWTSSSNDTRQEESQSFPKKD